MEPKNNQNTITDYRVIEGVSVRESKYKDRLKECKKVLDKEPQNVYLCANAKIVDVHPFLDDDKNIRLALKLNGELVQGYENGKRNMYDTFFDFQNNIIRVVCENARLRPIKEYMTNSIVLNTALIGAEISFYQIHRDGGVSYTLTNGQEYTGDNDFFESILLKIEVPEKAIENAISYAISVSK